MKIILYAAGGQGRSVYELIKNLNLQVVAYAEKSKVDWLQNITMIKDSDIYKYPKNVKIANGLGGVNPKNLIHRLNLITNISKKRDIISLVHKSAIVSNDCLIEEGVVIMPGSIIRSGAIIKKHSIINTGAIIEHDAIIGTGTHVAPGAVVLGSAKCGDCCMIASKSIITQKKILDANTFVKAGRII